MDCAEPAFFPESFALSDNAEADCFMAQKDFLIRGAFTFRRYERCLDLISTWDCFLTCCRSARRAVDSRGKEVVLWISQGSLGGEELKVWTMGHKLETPVGVLHEGPLFEQILVSPKYHINSVVVCIKFKIIRATQRSYSLRSPVAFAASPPTCHHSSKLRRSQLEFTTQVQNRPSWILAALGCRGSRNLPLVRLPPCFSLLSWPV
jgi:hypothetical protein